MLNIKLSLLALVALLSFGAAASASPAATQPTMEPENSGPVVVHLTLHPMAISQPVLRYRLLPPVADQRPGNGAIQYMMAVQSLPPDKDDKSPDDPQNRLDQQLEASPEAFSVAEADRVQALFPRRWIDMAARREHADWDIDFREEGVNTLLPHLNYLRELANVVALRARIAVVRGDFKNAERELQNDFSMARQLNAEAFVVQDLVAAGLARLILDRGVEIWVAQKDAPNLYWALSDLPQPYIDLHANLEQASLRFTSPLFAQALDGKLPPAQWTEALQEAIRLSRSFTRPAPSTAPADIEGQLKHLRDSNSAAAKKYLQSIGTPQEQIDAMPVDQLIGTWFVAQYTAMSDELWKAWPLPYPQAEPILIRAEEELDREKQNGNPFLEVISMPVARMRYTFADLDRHIAIVRLVEAARDYAARHDGRPPQRLDQITDVPVPNDPVTEKPFDYHADGQRAVIDAPAPSEAMPPEALLRLSPPRGTRYELTFVK